jgi:hypothetical protein
MHAFAKEKDDMLRWIGDSLKFLYWLGVLQLARLAVVLFCIGEVVGVLTLWASRLLECSSMTARFTSAAPSERRFLSPFKSRSGSSPGCGLRNVEASGERWRNGSRGRRYPVVRTPHPWE